MNKVHYSIQELKQRLDEIYSRYHHRRFVHPDPLEFLYHYDDLRDREIAGLVASCLAYGRVTQILKSVKKVLEVLGPSPYKYLTGPGRSRIRDQFSAFKHRFTTGNEVGCLLSAAAGMIERYGSLNKAFLAGYDDSHTSVAPAMLAFSRDINMYSDYSCCSLMPSHTGGSAFKRVNLFLRWMVRQDRVDPGGWKGIPQSKLLIPLDIHMQRISGRLGLTARKQADLKTVMEITGCLKKIDKNDPIRYDFALTRIGINRLGEHF